MCRTISTSWRGPPDAEENRMILRCGFLCVLIVTAGAAFAHHSAPVFCKVDERITVSGTVTEFRFSRPIRLRSRVAALLVLATNV